MKLLCKQYINKGSEILESIKTLTFPDFSLSISVCWIRFVKNFVGFEGNILIPKKSRTGVKVGKKTEKR